VYTLGETVNRIRKRLGKTMVAFGDDLGVRHSSVSQYESDKMKPSEGVLLQLLKMTDEDLERKRIVQALGASTGLTGAADEDQLIKACKELEEYFQIVEKEGLPDDDITPRTAAEQFKREAARISMAPELANDPAPAKLLRYWRQFGRGRAAQAVFAEVVSYLEVKLKILESRQAGSAGRKKPPKRG
jgi:transcriptional regulator with XRE-family HTH domain